MLVNESCAVLFHEIRGKYVLPPLTGSKLVVKNSEAWIRVNTNFALQRGVDTCKHKFRPSWNESKN